MRALHVIDADDPAAMLLALRETLSASGPALLPVAGGLAGLSSPAPAEVSLRTAVVVETSGSTGAAKRVALSADALLASAAASATALGAPGQWLLALPAHYIAGLNVLVRSIAAGTDPVILGTGHVDPAAFVAACGAMDAAAPRFTSLVPAQLATLVDAAEGEAGGAASASAGSTGTSTVLAALRRFDSVLVGGQATPAALLDRAAALGIRVTRSYGSSETAGGCVYDGVPIGTTTARIRDGQVELGGPVLAEGYLGDPGLTADRFIESDGARWYRTADAGTLTDGRLSITGRIDRVIISGGEKVSLDEVERMLHVAGHPRALAVSVPNDRWGEAIAVVSPTPVDLDELRELLGSRLGRAARPTSVRVVDRIPMLASGKPDRRALAELAGTGQHATGQDSTGQHATGQDSTGQDSTGQHATGQHGSA
ncbi:AMP-binding protein [Marisediminicola senii]|uniref:AMP-binding protein n=1 Tax=Marisediminicola senii TaxID=2711233 RepID=UPI001F39D924|nr:AMP-binding protein [Marisediminicola senii]